MVAGGVASASGRVRALQPSRLRLDGFRSRTLPLAERAIDELPVIAATPPSNDATSVIPVESIGSSIGAEGSGSDRATGQADHSTHSPGRGDSYGPTPMGLRKSAIALAGASRFVLDPSPALGRGATFAPRYHLACLRHFAAGIVVTSTLTNYQSESSSGCRAICAGISTRPLAGRCYGGASF